MLIARGVTRGDRVAVLSPNSAAYAVLFMGILRAGGCVVPLSTMASSSKRWRRWCRTVVRG